MEYQALGQAKDARGEKSCGMLAQRLGVGFHASNAIIELNSQEIQDV